MGHPQICLLGIRFHCGQFLYLFFTHVALDEERVLLDVLAEFSLCRIFHFFKMVGDAVGCFVRIGEGRGVLGNEAVGGEGVLGGDRRIQIAQGRVQDRIVPVIGQVFFLEQPPVGGDGLGIVSEVPQYSPQRQQTVNPVLVIDLECRAR
jgi:hypothetical protein